MQLFDSQHRSDTGDEFGLIDGTTQEIVGPDGDAFHAAFHIFESGNHYYRDGACFFRFFNFLTDLEAAFFGNHDIQQDKVRLVLRHAQQGLLAITG